MRSWMSMTFPRRTALSGLGAASLPVLEGRKLKHLDLEAPPKVKRSLLTPCCIHDSECPFIHLWNQEDKPRGSRKGLRVTK